MLLCLFSSCDNMIQEPSNEMLSKVTILSNNGKTRSTDDLTFLQGADLSYVNELEDVGVVYKKNGQAIDSYSLIKDYGANLVRIRLWHNPSWTSYSTLNDAKRSILRAKSQGLYVLLDFHYSDIWTDPQQNMVPAAWLGVVHDVATLGDSVYQYTSRVLQNLNDAGLLPDMVQIGNETNNNVMVTDTTELLPIDYGRNAWLFNSGLDAVAHFNASYSKDVKTVLHVAMNPSDAMNWVANHRSHDLHWFDLLGVSYYPQWQEYTPEELGEFASNLYSTYGIKLLVAETGHIWTRAWNDNNQNLMSRMCTGYPECPAPQFQKDFLVEVKNALQLNNGAGFCVWEPFWVSASNQTLWGIGSNWENVTFFGFDNNLLPHCGIEAYGDENVKVTFEVNMWNAGNGAKGYVTGDFTDDGFGNWQIVPMKQAAQGSSIYYLDTYLRRGQTGRYYFLSDSVWSSRETFNGVLQDRNYNISTTGTWQGISNNFSEL